MHNLFLLAYECLMEANAQSKCEKTVSTARQIRSGEVENKQISLDLIVPGRPEIPTLVPPQQLTTRKLSTPEGQAAMIHSFAHIEFNEINLAWDICCRFQEMPTAFYMDWAKVAMEEAKHFQLLRKRLQKSGYDYGSFPAHDGLWKMAEDTGKDILLRLAVVPRILEARGLDVTPHMINRFKEIDDKDSVDILNTIYSDEIGHVNIGSKWFNSTILHQEELHVSTGMPGVAQAFL